jgi:hypothetical protein
MNRCSWCIVALYHLYHMGGVGSTCTTRSASVSSHLGQVVGNVKLCLS